MSLTWVGVGVAGGALLSSMGKKGPDTSGQEAIAGRQVDLSAEELEFAKQIYADSAPDRAAASKRAGEVSDLQMEGMRKSISLADSYDNYNRSVYQPLERGIVRDAQNFDTEAEREVLAGKAVGDVRQGFATARDIGIRDLNRRGVNPNDGGYGSVAKQLALGEALGSAGAATKARGDAITLGRALKMDAASLGRNLPSQQATQTSLSLSAGNSAVGNAQVPAQVAANGQAMLSSGYRGAQTGLSSAGNIYGNIARQQAAGDDDSALYGAVGQVAGAYLGRR